MVQGVLNANSRKLIESWKSPLSNAENPGDTQNIAKPKKPKQTLLRETHDSAAESRAKLDVSAGLPRKIAKLEGILKGVEITEEDIEEAKKSLFHFKDLDD